MSCRHSSRSLASLLAPLCVPAFGCHGVPASFEEPLQTSPTRPNGAPLTVGEREPASLCPEGAAASDTDRPQVVITAPKRAAMLVGGTMQPSPVEVTGEAVAQTSPIVRLAVNGQALPVNGSQRYESFAVTIPARWGLSTIWAEVEDGCGRRGVLTQSFLRSPHYFAAHRVPTTEAQAIPGVVVHLKQSVVDDSDRSDLDDLATLAEAVLATTDFNGLVQPGQVLANDPVDCGGFCPSDKGYTFSRDPDAARQIRWQGPYVRSVALVHGGLELAVQVDDFRFPYRLRVRACTWYTACQKFARTFHGEIRANWIRASGTVGVQAVDGKVIVTPPSLSLESSKLELRLDCASWLQPFCNLVADQISGQVRKKAEEQLARVIASKLPPLLVDLLSGFSVAERLDLPTPLATSVQASFGLKGLAFCGPEADLPTTSACPAQAAESRYGELRLQTVVLPDQAGGSIPTLGPIRRGARPPPVEHLADPFVLAVSDDLLNQFLWATWSSGALTLDVEEFAPLIQDSGFKGLEISAVAHLPPVVMPGEEGSDVELGLGDVYVQVWADLGEIFAGEVPARVIHLEGWVSALIGGRITLDAATNELSIQVREHPSIHVQVVETDDPAQQAVVGDLLAALLGEALPELLGKALRAIPLPRLRISELASLPGDTVWQLVDGTIERENADTAGESDFYVLRGHFGMP